MKMRLLRFFARRPLALVVVGAASLVGIAVAAGTAAFGTADEPLTNPRMILNRGWYDSYPEKRTDVLKFYYFGGGGYGIYEEGSSFRYAVDVFELERQNDKLSIKFLQDGKTAETKFTITRCDDQPYFDLCLDIPDAPRGPKRYYSWAYDDEDSARIPGGAERLRRAEAQTAR
jgi:hypothetical protein